MRNKCNDHLRKIHHIATKAQKPQQQKVSSEVGLSTTYTEGVIHLSQDIFLVLNMIDVLTLDDLMLLH
jgi:hypothetical protein